VATTVEAKPPTPHDAPHPGTAAELRAVLGSEATKIRSVRSTMWTLLVAIFATAGIGALICLARVSRWSNFGPRELQSFDATMFSLRGVFLAQLAIGVLGVLVISSEYSTGMIRTTLAAVPQRRLLLSAKVIVFAVVAFVVAVVGCFGAFWAGQAILAAKMVPAFHGLPARPGGVSIADPGVLRAVLGGAVYLTAVGLLGLALGVLLRRTAGAIATLFGLVLVLPALVSALPSPWDTNVTKFLPSDTGMALFSVRHTSDHLQPAAALAVLAAYVVVALGLATVVLVRRDA
jgi:ABC-2 type transport system permease protein